MATKKPIDILHRKYRLHEQFDQLWCTDEERTECYLELRRILKTTPKYSHFKNMNTHPRLQRAEKAIAKMYRRRAKQIKQDRKTEPHVKKAVKKRHQKYETLSYEKQQIAFRLLELKRETIFHKLKKKLKLWLKK